MNLFRDLGYDEDSTEVKKARDGAQVYSRVIDALVHQRESCGLSQQEVARRMETSQSAVSKLENVGSDVRFSTMIRYAQALDCGLMIEVTGAVDRDEVRTREWTPNMWTSPSEAWDVVRGDRFDRQSWVPGDTVEALYAELPLDDRIKGVHTKRARAWVK